MSVLKQLRLEGVRRSIAHWEENRELFATPPANMFGMISSSECALCEAFMLGDFVLPLRDPAAAAAWVVETAGGVEPYVTSLAGAGACTACPLFLHQGNRQCGDPGTPWSAVYDAIIRVIEDASVDPYHVDALVEAADGMLVALREIRDKLEGEK